MMSPEYLAATTNAALFERPDRAFIRMYGRDPVRMIQGMVSNDVDGAPEGRGVYATLLTPKGRMIADLRVLKRAPDVLLELDRGAVEGTLAALKKFVPPLFARFEDPGSSRRALSIIGPAAADIMQTMFGDAVSAEVPEHAFVALPHEHGEVLVVRTLYTGEPGGFDVVAPQEAFAALHQRAREAGAQPASPDILDVLRIEAGRPKWGAELSEEVIPLEAGLRERAISETKGCYTGQEVIIRILHRGHVNRHLRGLLLGDAPPPASGTELFRPDDAKKVGVITSACISPRFGQTIALAYVRREVEPDASVHVAESEAKVVVLPFEHGEGRQA